MRARLTNLLTGESLDRDISGPGRSSRIGSSVAVVGSSFCFPRDRPELILVAGRLDVIRAEDGFIVKWTLRGRTVDVCAALAA